MTVYRQDRLFTNYVHESLALPLIYETLDWHPVHLDPNMAKKIDMQKGVDYVFKYRDQFLSVQERFREAKYKNYNDFTIRYRRDENKHEDRVHSEYFKMAAQYFLYGITNGSKEKIESNSFFIKWALLDLLELYRKIELEKIVILDNGKRSSQIVQDRIECPIKHNTDGSSSFIPIEISQLKTLWKDRIVAASVGFDPIPKL